MFHGDEAIRGHRLAGAKRSVICSLLGLWHVRMIMLTSIWSRQDCAFISWGFFNMVLGTRDELIRCILVNFLAFFEAMPRYHEYAN